VQAAEREIARQTAVRARALAAFASTRPASADRQPGEPGCMSAERRGARPKVLADVSEWAADEVALALSIPTTTAEAQLARALTLVHRLPGTLDALERGLLHVGHLWPMLDKVAPVADDAVRARLEADLLGWVASREVTTPAQLGDKARRELLARDLRCAARDLEAALRRRGVHVQPDRVEGMATLCALLTVPEAAALHDALGRYADAVVDDPAAGPVRSRQQKMADCLVELVLRPGETDLPAVRAQLTVVAGVSALAGGEAPAEIAGRPVPAEMVRALCRALDLLPGPDPGPGGDLDGAGPSGPWPDAMDYLDPAAEDAALAAADERWWAEVEARALRGEWGGEEDPPPDVLMRWWQEEAAWLAGRADAGDVLPAPGQQGDPSPEVLPLAPDPATSLTTTSLETEPSWWAAADAAVDDAAAAQRELLRATARARRAVSAAELAERIDEEEWRRSPAAAVSAAPDALVALARATEAQRAALADLLERTAGGGLVDRPRIAVTDALTGALLALTDAPELRRIGTCGQHDCRTGAIVCTHDLTGRPGLGPPGPSPTYRPGAALDRYLRARDRRCRFPGCRRPVPGGGELDHDRPWPVGPTAADNLTGYCTGHHRGKHQAPGWQHARTPDGTLTVRTPSGLTASSTPPPY
jgi:hypothetical protein